MSSSAGTTYVQQLPKKKFIDTFKVRYSSQGSAIGLCSTSVCTNAIVLSNS